GARRGGRAGGAAAFLRGRARPAGPGGWVTSLGGCLPLHGIGAVLDAVARLEARAASLPAFVAQLVGAGIEYEEARATARERRLTHVEFTGRTDYDDAPRVLASSHVALGAFGAGEKTGRVI